MRTSLAIDELAAYYAHSTLPEVWLDLVHGRVSADDAAAAASVDEPDELVERSRVLFAPPSAEDEERRLQALLAAHFDEPARPAPAARPTRSRWIVGSVVAVLAASLLLVITPRMSRPPAFDGGYTLDLSPGYLEQRAEPTDAAGPRRYREGQRIVLGLRPADTVTTPVDVEVFAYALADGHGHALSVEPEINEYGVVTLAGSTDAMGLSVGRWRLVVVVGPRQHLPQTLAEVQDGPEAPYDVLEAEVEIVSADPSSP